MYQKINWEKTVGKKVKALPDSGLGKFLDIIALNKNIVSLSIGEPDFTAPLCVRNQAIKGIEEGITTSYTSSYGMIELRKAICEMTEKKYNVSYNPENEIAVTVGVSEALDLTMRVLLEEGDEVLLPEPCYVANKACIVLAGGTSVPVPTFAEDGFVVKVAELEKYVTTKTKALMISYPTNPTGATMKKEELEEIAKFAEKHNLIVISDELYADLTYVGNHTCFSSLPGMKERTIILSGFSKTYAMTGFRIGYVLAPKDFIAAMINIHQYTMLCAPAPSQYAAIEAIRSAHKDYEHMYDTYNKRRQLMINGFQNIGLPTFSPEGAFYIFPNISQMSMTSSAFCEELLEKYEVAVIPGDAFGKSGEGFIRCSYATSTENLNKALDRIDRFINGDEKQVAIVV